MTGRASQRRATTPYRSRYCSVYARAGACALTRANSATMALSPFRLILGFRESGRSQLERCKLRGETALRYLITPDITLRKVIRSFFEGPSCSSQIWTTLEGPPVISAGPDVYCALTYDRPIAAS